MPSRSYKFPAKFRDQVREACRYDYSDPAKLNDLPLASVALQAALLQDPHHPTDPAGRAAALQKALDLPARLAELKPDGPYQATLNHQRYFALYYLTYGHDPYTGASIHNIATYLKTREKDYKYPRLTYHHRLRQALEQLCIHLSRYLTQYTTLLEPAPKPAYFVGRTEAVAAISYLNYRLIVN